MGVISAYNLLAPVYDLSRPLWAQWIMGRAEAYMEQEVLPGLLRPETRILDGEWHRRQSGPAATVGFTFRQLHRP